MAFKKIGKGSEKAIKAAIIAVFFMLLFALVYLNYFPSSTAEQKTRNIPLCNATCSDIGNYFSSSMKTESATDLVIVFDHSRSMLDGNKMQKAKSALSNIVDIISPRDRVSIIVFDNSSQIVQNFTSNHTAIKKSIAGIPIGYSTRYSPALQKAYYDFLRKGNRNNKWTVLFVSDGEPKGENIDDICNIVRKMTRDGICINTIGYGKEITKGSKAERILSKMALISYNQMHCGNYYFAPKDAGEFATVLGIAYKKTAEKSHFLDLAVDYNSLSLPDNMSFVLSVKLSSNKNPVPGEKKTANKTYCAPEANVSLLLCNISGLCFNLSMNYSLDKKAYVLSRKLPPGQYDAYVHYSLFAHDKKACGYYDDVFIGALNITKKRHHFACTADSCEDIRKYVMTAEADPVVYVDITDYAFIPQNITIQDKTTVVWINKGRKNHTVTSGKKHYDGLFNSGILQPGESFNITFANARPIDYFDNLSVMRGRAKYSGVKGISLEGFTLKYNGSIDIALLIDSSESMHDKKLENAKSAALKLIKMLYPGDDLAIISFNDRAMIIHNFTDNKAMLSRQIKGIYASGSTLYLPPLEKAEKIYNGVKKGKVAILLSDGLPWDNPDEIYSKAKQLADKGICIYTIGYGDDIKHDSRARQMLMNIAKISQESEKCGKYYYAPSDETRLIKIFGSIYYDNKDKLNALAVSLKLNKAILFDNESLIANAIVKSAFNNRKIPGRAMLKSQTLCSPEAYVVAEISQGRKTIIKKQLSYNGLGYSAEIKNLNPGKYTVKVTATTRCTDYLCDIVGHAEQNITVKRPGKLFGIF